MLTISRTDYDLLWDTDAKVSEKLKVVLMPEDDISGLDFVIYTHPGRTLSCEWVEMRVYDKNNDNVCDIRINGLTLGVWYNFNETVTGG